MTDSPPATDARPWWPVKGGRPHPMCSVADWIGGEECLRVAQWRIDPPDEHPVFLCNFHADPFVPLGNFGSVARADAAL